MQAFVEIDQHARRRKVPLEALDVSCKDPVPTQTDQSQIGETFCSRERIHQAPEERRRSFADSLRRAGFKVTVRYSLGADITAACGQLVRFENTRAISRQVSASSQTD